jgi:cytidine deaminase
MLLNLYYITRRFEVVMSKKITFEVLLEEYQKVSELPEDSQTLIIKARENCQSAYAPYSNFKVGAAVLLENGAIVSGANQENSSFPSGLCAERVALFAAACRHPELLIRKIALTATQQGKASNEILRPCGGCLQVLSEYQKKQNEPIEIIMESTVGTIQIASSVNMLLPFTFTFGKPG